MATLSVDLDPETMLKLTRRAARVNMTPRRAVRVIATKGVRFFLSKLVAPTNGARRSRDSKRNKSGAYLCVHVGRKNGLDVFEDIPPVKRTRNSKRNRKAVAV
jgi:hypothetical protein